MKNTALFVILTGILLANPVFGQADKKGKSRGRGNPEKAIQSFDKNNDGKISLSEAPEMMKSRFQQIDSNGDGLVDGQELKQAFAKRMQRGGQPGANPRGDAPGQPKAGNPGPARPGGKRLGPGGPGGMNLAKLFEEGDKNGDGNLNAEEQRAIIERFNQMLSRFRQMGAEKGKQPQTGRFARPNTDPVKPKRPGN